MKACQDVCVRVSMDFYVYEREDLFTKCVCVCVCVCVLSHSSQNAVHSLNKYEHLTAPTGTGRKKCFI